MNKNAQRTAQVAVAASRNHRRTGAVHQLGGCTQRERHLYGHLVARMEKKRQGRG